VFVLILLWIRQGGCCFCIVAIVATVHSQAWGCLAVQLQVLALWLESILLSNDRLKTVKCMCIVLLTLYVSWAQDEHPANLRLCSRHHVVSYHVRYIFCNSLDGSRLMYICVSQRAGSRAYPPCAVS
jgi:hypothetical protein